MSRRISRFRYLVLVIFPLALFATTILGKRALFWGTPLNQFVPWWSLAWESLSSGILPLWNPQLGMGAPLLANYQTALIYPPTWFYFITYTLGGIGVMAWLMAVMVVVHLSWASIGMALLIREMKLSQLAQVVSGLAFGLSGYLVARAGFLSINAAVAWLPWILLGASKLVFSSRDRSDVGWKMRSVGGFVLLVCAAAMQLLAGHAQTAWYSLLFASAWVVYLVVVDPWLKTRREKQVLAVPDPGQVNQPNKESSHYQGYQGWWKSKAWLVILFAGALLLATGLAAVQLLPTAEYLLESQRSATVDYEYAISYSFWPWHFLNFISPGMFGNPALGDYWGYANYWEDAVYIGLLPFGLAIWGLITLGRRLPRKSNLNPGLVGFLGLTILVTFVIALGRFIPIFPWLFQNVPTFDMFQGPTRISILAVMSLAILAAVGVDSWSAPTGRQAYWLRLGVMAGGAITIGAGLALLLSRSLAFDVRPSFIRAAAWLGLWAVGLGFLTLKAPAKDQITGPADRWMGWHWAVIIWVGLDLVVAGWGLNPSVDLGVYTDSSPTAEQVRQLSGEGRIFLPWSDEETLKFERFLRFDTFDPFQEGGDWHDLRGSLLPNITVLDALPSANNFDPMLPGRYSTWMNELKEADIQTASQMLNLMGITVVESIDSNGVRFDQRAALPRFRWVSCGISAADEFEALEMIRSSGLEFDRHVIIEGEVLSIPQNCSQLSQIQIEVVDETPASYEIRIDSQEGGYLVMSDVWYPGWQAAVDDSPAEIKRANYLFRAVWVPAGDHLVEISYRPAVFYAGALVSGTASLGLIALLYAWSRMRKGSEKQTEDSGT